VISASGAADPSHVQIIVPNDAIIKQWTQQYMADADPEERKAYAKTQENYVKRKQEWEEAERKRDFIIETKRRIQEAVEEEKTKGEQDRAHIRASYSTRKPEINFPEKDGPVIVMDKPRKRVYDR
jgi:type II secretory pathway component HofQ